MVKIAPNWHSQKPLIIDRSMGADVQTLLNAIEHIVGLAYGVGTANVPVENWRALERTAETIRGRRPA